MSSFTDKMGLEFSFLLAHSSFSPQACKFCSPAHNGAKHPPLRQRHPVTGAHRSLLSFSHTLLLAMTADETVVAVAGTTDAQGKLAADLSTLEIANGTQHNGEQPAHRSHDPQYNQKRSDPFQFGSRLLGEEDDPFEFNAWDHVEVDDEFKEFAEQQYEMQRQAPVSEFDKFRFNSDPAKWWNKFYKNNTSNFFKDRKWLQQEFPVLDRLTQEDAGAVTILEIGAGAGNTAFPVLSRNKNPKLKLHACDFSKTAVDVMRNHESYKTDQMQADVWDVAGEELPPGLGEGSVDLVMMVFIFSALAPSQWKKAVENVYRVLKPGGEVCFRDYGRGDLAQVRFKKGRYLEENFYIRGDGTRVYFFEKDELADIWSGKLNSETADGDAVADSVKPKFEIEELGVDRRMLVNRARKLKMYRCWMQGRFRKV